MLCVGQFIQANAGSQVIELAACKHGQNSWLAREVMQHMAGNSIPISSKAAGIMQKHSDLGQGTEIFPPEEQRLE